MHINFIAPTQIGKVPTRLQVRHFGMSVVFVHVFSGLARQGSFVKDINQCYLDIPQLKCVHVVVNTVDSKSRRDILLREDIQLKNKFGYLQQFHVYFMY